MRIALSTNWCNRRMESGEEIADKAMELGFDELELGFHTSVAQVPGFKSRLDRMPVGSIHAFCPVPISAPQGYPELYSLASFDQDARALARFHITRNIEFAADIGARTVVLHAGRVSFASFFRRNFTSGLLRAVLQTAKGDLKNKTYDKVLARAMKIRRERGAKMLEFAKAELAALVPVLERCGVVLALENLPYLEGFPDETEMRLLATEFAKAPVAAWFDTGHHRVREMHGWTSAPLLESYRGFHLNDVVDYNDDHLAPGQGKVDFAALMPLIRSTEHIVVEPNSGVTEDELHEGLAYFRALTMV